MALAPTNGKAVQRLGQGAAAHPAHNDSWYRQTAEDSGRERSAGPRALTFGFLLGLVFWAVLLFIVLVATTWGYQLHGFRWTKLDPGYSADPSVSVYTTEGMRQWSSVSGLRPVAGGSDIKVTVAALLPPFYAGQPAQSNVSNNGAQIESCEIRLDPVAFFALPEQARQSTVTHELGHCLGINHSDLPGVMKNPVFYNFSDDDAAAVVSLYGKPAPPEQPAQAAQAAPPEQPAKQALKLLTGWNLVVWPETAAPTSCGCKAVYAARGADLLHWIGDGPTRVNTLTTLEGGQPYWVLK